MARNDHTDDHTDDTSVDTRGARMRVPRSRGAVSGLLLILLGTWGALIPLVGPYVHFGYTPDSTWHITSGRVWLEILPGAVAVLGGLLLLVAANRVTTSFGSWLGVAAGAWFIINTPLNTLFNLGSVGAPIHTSKVGKTLEFLLLFDGLGALILFIAATALGRLGVISVRDVEAARRRNNDDRTVEHDAAPVRRTVRETPVVQTERVTTEPVARTIDTVDTHVVPTKPTTARDDLPPEPPRGGATRLDDNT